MPYPRRSRFCSIVFDLDGTLIDSVGDISLGINRVLAEEGLPTLSVKTVRTLVGDGATTLVRDAFVTAGRPLGEPDGVKAMTRRYLDHYAEQDVDPGCLYPGVVETLAMLDGEGFSLALCTNKAERITLPLLEELGLARHFDAVVGGDTLASRKPSPEPLLFALQRIGGRPDAAVMVGDNRNDVAAARGAGMPVVAVSYGYPRMAVEALGADRVIDRFADLPAALDKLAG
ncbi:MAG TPA: phosphoglycolate phosphatase [Azospirillaceae bacterium]|nr:phosphoglycolate phosphatase [Azospirillaceae bacterium]